MKYFFILFISLLSFTHYNAQTVEKIKAFHTKIEVQKDRSVIVTEQIEIFALGIKINRGIYRDIPLNFKLPEQTIRQKLKVLSIERNGKPEKYKTDLITGGIRIYIGSEEKNITQGEHTYKIIYSLDRTVFCPDDYCQLMWNANGNQWDMRIDTLSAVISLPENEEITSYDAWRGSYGESNQKNFFSKSIEKGKRVFTAKKLNAGENLTFSVAFDKSAVNPISASDKMSYYFRDNAVYILGIIGIIIIFIVNFILWKKYGVDPKKGTIIPQYYAPKDWSPAEVLFLVNEGKEDKNMFVAQLLQLAVKGHIKIEKRESSKKKESYIISATEPSVKKEELNSLEKGFIHLLLGNKPYIIISDKYNASVGRANSFLISRLEKQQSKVYFRKNKHLLIPQYIPAFISLLAMGAAAAKYDGPIWFILLTLVLIIVMNLIFMRLFYQPTKKGRKMLDHILGFELFITHADELRIKATNQPDMNFDFYERNLPYAVAFGKVDEWGKKFQAKEIEAGYQSSNYYVKGTSFRHLVYIGGLTTMASRAAVPPSSAGSSGGGFSGGGFSGGGAGGGGGGGW